MYKADYLTKILLGLLVVGVWSVLLQPLIQTPEAAAQSKSEQTAPQVIRARGLVIVDDEGRERIFIGAVPDGKEGKRRSPLTGITINDPAGYERLGMGLMDNGTITLGLDAPPGTGDDRNRERIHLTADADGSAMLRFLNRKTTVAGWMRLGNDDKLNLEFLDVQPEKNKVKTRRLNLRGDETVEETLK